MDRNNVELKSFWFFDVHKLVVEYEHRDVSEVLSTEKIRKGFPKFGLQPILYDRLSKSLPVTGNCALKPGQAIAPIKLLSRLNKTTIMTVETPVFMFAFGNYDKKLEKRQNVIRDHCLMTTDSSNKVESILEVPIGGMFAVKSSFGDDFFRVRILKINLTNKIIEYWAVDEAFYGEARTSDLLYLNELCAMLEMLAVPAVFEEDPSPSQLMKFDGASNGYCMAKITQPKYSHDFGPRKIVLI